MALNFCPGCGYRLREVLHFCPNCGRRLRKPEAQAPTNAVPNPYGNVPNPYGNVPTPYDNLPNPFNHAPDGTNTVPCPGRSVPDPANPLPWQAYAAPYPAAGAVYPPVPAPYQPPAKPVDPMARSYRLTTLGTLVTYATVSSVSSALLALVALICSALFLRQPTSDISDILSELSDSGPALQILLWSYVVGYVGGLLLGMLISGTIRRRLPAEPPEQRPLTPLAFLRCALAAFGLWGVGVLIGNFPSFIVPVETMSFGWDGIPTWLLAIVVAPIFEELIFRKLVLDRVGRFGELPAVLCSALIFGLAHQNAGQFFLAFLLGLLFARIYLRTGKIVYTMLLHFMINLTATLEEVGLLIWGDGFELWYLIAIGALMLAGLVILALYRKDPILGLPGRLSPDDRGKSMRTWPVTLVKWICVVTILLYGVLYSLIAGLGSLDPTEIRSFNPLGLLYLIPAILATVFILVLARRPKRQSAPSPVFPAAQ